MQAGCSKTGLHSEIPEDHLLERQCRSDAPRRGLHNGMPEDRWLERQCRRVVGLRSLVWQLARPTMSLNWQPGTRGRVGVSAPTPEQRRGLGGAIQVSSPTAGFDRCRGPPTKGGWTAKRDRRAVPLPFCEGRNSRSRSRMIQYPRVANHGDPGC